LSIVAKLIGVSPGQFVALVAISQLSENFQHANFRFSFGAWGERLWVSPRFHRLHHAVGIGHESAGRQTLGGHNFGVLFPGGTKCWAPPISLTVTTPRVSVTKWKTVATMAEIFGRSKS
jgi:hypothetical protein